MVGVPGRSKACTTCKKRRVACDAQRPSCGQCISAARQCGGYARPYIFVSNDDGSHKTVYRKRMSQPSTAGADVDHAHQSETPHSRVLMTPCHASTALEEQQLFARAITSQSNQVPDSCSAVKPWNAIASTFIKSDSSLCAAPLACCVAWLGRQANDKRMTDASRDLYLQGLYQVRKALSTHVNVRQDDTLGACMALVMYETLECPELSKASYSWHREGCARLIELRGPEAHQEASGHELFLAFRIHGVCY